MSAFYPLQADPPPACNPPVGTDDSSIEAGRLISKDLRNDSFEPPASDRRVATENNVKGDDDDELAVLVESYQNDRARFKVAFDLKEAEVDKLQHQTAALEAGLEQCRRQLASTRYSAPLNSPSSLLA